MVDSPAQASSAAESDAVAAETAPAEDTTEEGAAGEATPANVGTLCSTSDLFCCSTGLFVRAKASSARNRPIELKTKPVKKRGAKKADFETSFLFIRESLYSLERNQASAYETQEKRFFAPF